MEKLVDILVTTYNTNEKYLRKQIESILRQTYKNINIYISYGLGIIISFILGTLLINYLLKKRKRLMEIMIGSFSIYSILMMGVMTFSKMASVIEIILGIMLMIVGIVIGFIMDNKG